MGNLSDDLNAFQKIAETASDAPQVFRALETFCQSQVGVKLFSCSIFDLKTRQAKRAYTNDDVNYPLSGLKDIQQSRWTDAVLDRGEIFVANDVDGFKDVFEDHEKIADLGLASAINVPIILAQRFMGTVNLLHEEGYYTPERCSNLLSIKLPAMIAFSTMDS